MKLLHYLSALFYPDRCPYCGVPVEPGEIACRRCYDELRQKHQPIQCGAKGYRCVASFVYGGKVRRMILRMKYHNRTQYIPQISVILAEDIRKAYGGDAFDLITAVPMHKKDLLEREYNQSELLAKETGKLLGIPYRATLLKVKRTKKQHNLNYAERKTNLSGAFELIDNDRVRDKRILIIDDIITSGNTLGSCCRKQNRAKPAAVCCAAVASARNRYPASTII